MLKCDIFGAVFLSITLLPLETLSHPNYIDLTHTFKTDQPRWPGGKIPTLTSLAKGLVDMGGESKVYVALNEFYTVGRIYCKDELNIDINNLKMIENCKFFSYNPINYSSTKA